MAEMSAVVVKMKPVIHSGLLKLIYYVNFILVMNGKLILSLFYHYIIIILRRPQ